MRDLLHPALFAYVKGVSPVTTPLEADSAGVGVDSWGRKFESSKYQWLPCHFDVDKQGRVRIPDYINNLSRVKYDELYKNLAELFSVCLPYLEAVYSYGLQVFLITLRSSIVSCFLLSFCFWKTNKIINKLMNK